LYLLRSQNISINTSNMKNSRYKKGIALFIAVIAVSAMLLIAFSISDISYREQIITFAGRDSKVALYAADSGIECALFHDWGRGLTGDFEFPTFTDFSGHQSIPGMHCGGREVPADVEGNNGFAATTTFYFDVSLTPKACAVVQVVKWSNDGGVNVNTKIDSRGYNNTCKDEGPTHTVRLSDYLQRNIERSFRMSYP